MVHNSTSSIANNLIGQVNNEARPIIRPSDPAFFNPQFFQQINPQNTGNFAPNPSANNFATPAQVNSTVSVNNTGANSQVVSNVILPPQ